MDASYKNAVKINPSAEKTPDTARAILCPAFLERFAPSKPPIQKKVIAKVKLRASSLCPQPNSADRGDLSIDHAYKTPAKSIAKTPTAMYSQRIKKLRSVLFIRLTPLQCLFFEMAFNLILVIPCILYKLLSIVNEYYFQFITKLIS